MTGDSRWWSVRSVIETIQAIAFAVLVVLAVLAGTGGLDAIIFSCQQAIQTTEGPSK